MLDRVTIVLVCFVAFAGPSASAYDPKGHETVGAIADLRLAGKPIATKLPDILDGLTLLASTEPQGWQLDSKIPVEKWSLNWANQILLVAREAHERLDYAHITIVNKLAKGQALERMGAMSSYHDWPGQTVREQLHKAGWRLAALLEAVVQ